MAEFSIGMIPDIHLYLIPETFIIMNFLQLAHIGIIPFNVLILLRASCKLLMMFFVQDYTLAVDEHFLSEERLSNK